MQPPRQEKLLSEEVRRVAETQFRKLSDWKAQSRQVLSDFEKQNNAGKTAEQGQQELQPLSLPYDAAELKVLLQQVATTAKVVKTALPKAEPKKRAAEGANTGPSKRLRAKGAVGGA